MNELVTQFSLKHRPSTFDKVKGQDLVVKELKNRFGGDNWPSAMLFQGPTGVGKTTLGFIVAASIQCSNPTKEGPCGVCPTCKDIFDEKFSLGCTVMLDGSTSSKDDVIEKISALSHTIPFNGKKQIFIIEEVDQLSPAAKNSFHKLLEKPSPYVHFILLSMTEANGNKVPESIATRCQVYHLKDLIPKDVAYTMKDVLESEGIWNSIPIDFKKEGIFLLANNAKGSMRRALQFLERVITGGFYSKEDIEEVFHFVTEETSISLLRSFLIKDKIKTLSEVERLKNQNKLMDWVFLTHFFLITNWTERLRGDVEFTSPSSMMLGKFDKKDILNILDKLYTPILNIVNTKGWISNTHLMQCVLYYIENDIPAHIPLRTRS